MCINHGCVASPVGPAAELEGDVRGLRKRDSEPEALDGEHISRSAPERGLHTRLRTCGPHRPCQTGYDCLGWLCWPQNWPRGLPNRRDSGNFTDAGLPVCGPDLSCPTDYVCVVSIGRCRHTWPYNPPRGLSSRRDFENDRDIDLPKCGPHGSCPEDYECAVPYGVCWPINIKAPRTPPPRSVVGSDTKRGQDFQVFCSKHHPCPKPNQCILFICLSISKDSALLENVPAPLADALIDGVVLPDNKEQNSTSISRRDNDNADKTPPPQCYKDPDCPKRWRCWHHICRPGRSDDELDSTQLLAYDERDINGTDKWRICGKNSDCPRRYRCLHHLCRPIEETDSANEQLSANDQRDVDDADQRCNRDHDCPRGWHCHLHKCQLKRGELNSGNVGRSAGGPGDIGDANTRCHGDYDCRVGWYCYLHLCRNGWKWLEGSHPDDVKRSTSKQRDIGDADKHIFCKKSLDCPSGMYCWHNLCRPDYGQLDSAITQRDTDDANNQYCDEKHDCPMWMHCSRHRCQEDLDPAKVRRSVSERRNTDGDDRARCSVDADCPASFQCYLTLCWYAKGHDLPVRPQDLDFGRGPLEQVDGGGDSWPMDAPYDLVRRREVAAPSVAEGQSDIDSPIEAKVWPPPGGFPWDPPRPRAASLEGEGAIERNEGSTLTIVPRARDVVRPLERRED